MAIEKVNAKVIRADEDTPGGTTYYIQPMGKDFVRALCFRQIHGHPDLRCAKSSGFNTWHKGTGACSRHGGATPEGNTIKTGMTSKIRQRLAVGIDKYLKLDRAQLLDLTYELATTRAVFEEFLEELPTPDSDEYGMWFHRFTEIIGTMGSLVEKISKIENRNTLTAAQVLYLRATVADLLMKYIQDPAVRMRAAQELQSRMGGDIEVTLDRSEYALPKRL